MKSYDKPKQHLKSRDLRLWTTVCIVKAMGFPVIMYGCENWTIKKAECQRIDAFNFGAGEDSWESLGLHKLVNPKGNQPWILIGRTDAEAPILWPSDLKIWLIGKDPDAGKDWRKKEKWVTEHEMAVWHHWLNGHEFEQSLRDSEGQGSLAGCSPWDLKESNRT